MRKYLASLIVLAIFGWSGCGDSGGGGSSVGLTAITTLTSFTPRFYKAGDTASSALRIDADFSGTRVVWTGTQNVTVSDGGTVNGCACMLATVDMTLSSSSPIADAMGMSYAHMEIRTWFYEDSSGFYCVRVEEEDLVEGGTDTTDYGSFGSGELDVPYPITASSSWSSADWTPCEVTGQYTVSGPAGTFDCFEVSEWDGDTLEYYCQELGSKLAVYEITPDPDFTTTIILTSYYLVP